MSSDPSRAASGTSTPTASHSNASQAVGKKKPRLAPLMPAAALRQKKRRGGGAPALASARKLAGKIRSGTSTPTRQRSATQSMSISIDALAIPGATAAVAETASLDKRDRRGSNAGPAAKGVDSTAGGRGRSGSTARDGEHADDDDDEDAGDGDGNAPTGALGIENDSITLIQQSNDEVRELLDQMTDEQQQRYDVYRRTALNKGAIKKLCSHVLNQQISSTLSFVIAGFSKVFVGEIVELAVQIKSERGDDDGPLRPEHLREAYRLYKKDHQNSSASGFTKRMF
ncbi:transcription initiation factor TFIID subunit 11 [Coemansia erecta]|uniref:Transcription initiation factor TFIID subunit 11 n=1 Tax=Coemansia erecta TaxID=147472 RepID=A0A9W7Y5S1_9FUNG|nr:transcription initiation factor TFIID subunit 11 [Coemansia erecta]